MAFEREFQREAMTSGSIPLARDPQLLLTSQGKNGNGGTILLRRRTEASDVYNEKPPETWKSARRRSWDRTRGTSQSQTNVSQPASQEFAWSERGEVRPKNTANNVGLAVDTSTSE